jgi:hypothetical protein
MVYPAQRKKEVKSGAARKKNLRRIFWAVAVLLIAALGAVHAYLSFSAKNNSKRPQTSISTQGHTVLETDSTVSAQDFRPLIGRWVRPDGGYVIEIRAIDAQGKLDAGYYNPRPVNVSKAHVSKRGPESQVFIELRDTGYPGSTYTLNHNPGKDLLAGIYHQAAQGQNYNVVFIRMK